MEAGQTLLSESYWTAKEAASYLGVSTNTLYGYVKLRRNRPPCIRLAGKTKGRWRFPKNKFIEWANGSAKG